ncbi:alpha/beta hydrolase [Blastopirellula retiformator]|uniref:Acetylxylan esterase n=1 Tax=Blastopirellula retiformator TaxID=2527970 RepID=A0A5C5VMF1_9BACT|nr:alpha/beta hydrolase [Blastopirellula retiformator]TWT38892.1 Acetylxylan esterase precursor [Blastopirellula retiformator]
MKSLLAAALLALIAAPAFAENVEVILWPAGQVPGQDPSVKEEIVEEIDQRSGRKVTKVTKPMITVYQPAADKKNGAAVVVCPGGGYNILAYDLEGTEVAKWLNDIGVTAVVLHYRVPRAKGDYQTGPMQDAQRAIRLTRQNAKAWGIDPDRIGLLGFSAGGNLTAITGVGHDLKTYDEIDEADKQSARPDFLVLVYPAYLTTEPDSVELNDRAEVTETTPPAIMIHAANDPVPCNNSVAFFMGLKRLKTPAELHVYPTGGHGYGLRPTEHEVTNWPKVVTTFMEKQGVLEAKK